MALSTSCTVDQRLPHTGDALDARLHEAVGDVRELEEVVVVARERHVEERLRVGILLGDDGLLDLLGEPRAHARHLVADILRRAFDLAVQGELESDVAELLDARAGERLEAGKGAQLLFQDVRDRRLHHPRVGAAQESRDRDHRWVDVGELPHRQLRVADRAEEHERGAEHAREDGTADGEVGELHRRRGCVVPQSESRAGRR
jgi:hypothetical protein